MKIDLKNTCLAIHLFNGHIIFVDKVCPRDKDLLYQARGKTEWDRIHQSAVVEVTIGIYEV